MRSGKTEKLCWMLCILAAAGLVFCFSAAAAEEARNIAAECSYRYQRDSAKNTGDLYNGNYSYYWKSAYTRDPWLEVTLPEGIKYLSDAFAGTHVTKVTLPAGIKECENTWEEVPGAEVIRESNS